MNVPRKKRNCSCFDENAQETKPPPVFTKLFYEIRSEVNSIGLHLLKVPTFYKLMEFHLHFGFSASVIERHFLAVASAG